MAETKESGGTQDLGSAYLLLPEAVISTVHLLPLHPLLHFERKLFGVVTRAGKMRAVEKVEEVSRVERVEDTEERGYRE